MLNKNFLIISIITIYLAIGAITNAQENPTEKKDTKMVKQYDDPQKCMDKIAADSTMRMQMMDQCKGDKEGMMQMCKTMMNNPEMHKMMMDEEGKMKNEMKNHDMESD